MAKIGFKNQPESKDEFRLRVLEKMACGFGKSPGFAFVTETPISWQTCPICKGSGNNPIGQIGTMQTMPPCTVCKGKKIISLESGKPPE